MKNLKKFAEEICAILTSLLLIAIIIFAMKQESMLSLAILLSIVVLQMFLSNKKFPIFAWDMMLKVQFKACADASKVKTIKENKKEFLRFLLNSLFNGVKLFSFLCILYIAIRDYKDMLNPFGLIGMIITFLFLFKIFFFRIKNYLKKIRSIKKQVLGLSRVEEFGFVETTQHFISPVKGLYEKIMRLFIIIFLYLTFGTSLIWLVILGSMVYFFFSGTFKEFRKKVNESKIFADKILMCGIISVLVSSLIIQFRAMLSDFFYLLKNVFLDFFTIEIFNGFYVWTIALVLLLMLVSIMVIIMVHKDKKNERKKMEEQRIENEKRKMEKEERLARKEGLRKENSVYIANLEKGLQIFKRGALIEEVIGLAKRASVVDFEGVEKLNVKSLTKPRLISLLQISNIKQKIVWNSSDLNNVIKMFEYLYKKNYDDVNLLFIVALFDNFIEDLEPYRGYVGYNKILNSLKGVTIPFNKKRLYK